MDLRREQEQGLSDDHRHPCVRPGLASELQGHNHVAVDFQAVVAQLLQIRTEAAICIQRSYRNHLAHILHVVACLMKVRSDAVTTIQTRFRGHIVRKQLPILKLRQKERLIRWTKPAQEVFLAGTFTYPPWERHIRMHYLKIVGVFYSTFLMETKLEPGVYTFKFCVDGIWSCSSLYSVTLDTSGNSNNCITIAGEKRTMPRATSARNLGSEAVSTDLATRPQYPETDSEPQLARTMSGNLDSPLGFNFREGDGPAEIDHLRLVFAGYMAAHPKTRHAPLTPEGSADRYFIEPEAQCFGVADGVGEWQTFGLDPSRFPTELMESSKQLLLSKMSEIKDLRNQDVINVMLAALSQAENSTHSFGSSTAMLALCKDNVLHIIYLGDSSFIVLRRRENSTSLNTVYRSMEQQHSFNCPFQLANLPKADDYPLLMAKGLSSLVSLLKKSTTPSQDSALDARTEIIRLKPGDVIIAATDGLFDNLYDSDITKIAQVRVESGFEGQELAETLSRELVQRAIEKGWDPMYRSPFAKTAQRAGKRFNGGKLDDTSVVVGVAVGVD